MNDLIEYLTLSFAWSVVGFLIGVRVGMRYRPEEPGEPEHHHHWNAIVGIVLAALGVGMLAQGWVLASNVEEQRDCLVDHANRQVERNVEEARAHAEFLTDMQAGAVRYGTPEAATVIDEYTDHVAAINRARVEDTLDGCDLTP